MNEADILAVARQAIYVTLKLSVPPMLVALIVGVIVSVFQALTQIQEQTLTFIPKIIVIFLTVLLLLPFMIGSLTSFTHAMIDHIIAIQ
jgi:flagellar biosynthetic protein FliQ